MDKETLSNYGWIVILVLVLAVMLALASPFGNFVATAVKSTTKGLFDVNHSGCVPVLRTYLKTRRRHPLRVPSLSVRQIRIYLLQSTVSVPSLST